VPSQDKQYLVGFAQLPDGATLDRTEDVIRRMSDIALKSPGVEARWHFRACRSTDSPTVPMPALCS
jgi:multidrug efflux pump subunit AcrB